MLVVGLEVRKCSQERSLERNTRYTSDYSLSNSSTFYHKSCIYNVRGPEFICEKHPQQELNHMIVNLSFKDITTESTSKRYGLRSTLVRDLTESSLLTLVFTATCYSSIESLRRVLCRLGTPSVFSWHGFRSWCYRLAVDKRTRTLNHHKLGLLKTCLPTFPGLKEMDFTITFLRFGIGLIS